VNNYCFKQTFITDKNLYLICYTASLNAITSLLELLAALLEYFDLASIVQWIPKFFPIYTANENYYYLPLL